MQWICAGDPAQMISPGCSFHFDGLKQTLLSVRSGIEASLSSVSQLLVNYRTTKDVLDLANKVLGVARDTFPDSIPFARTEVANKDLGLRVVLCDWDVACRENIDLGTNQACVFSSANPAMLEKEAKNWLGSQPFIMSSLDSKGLEFDDVIVAFDYDRKVWRVCDKRVASLRMLRELYVAVTRARQRVVVLVKKGVPEMASFFESLNCDFQTTHSHLVLRDFTRVTSAGDWLERAKDFFEGENFRMAARCFDFAKDDGWCRWSQGKDFSMTGNYASAAEEYLAALQIFGLKKDHDLVLQVGLALADRGVSKNVSWDTKNSPFLKEALLVRSESLTRRNRIRIALLGILWEEVMVSDLKDESLTHLFSGYRGNAHFKAKIAETTKEELNAIERVLPLAVADCHCDQARYADSVRVFLFVGDQRGAINATTKALHDVRIGSGVESLPNVVTAWARSGVSSQDPVICTLLKLFQSVEKAASAIAKDALRYLGREIIIAAVDADENVDRLLLHTFSPADFFLEVSAVLENKFKRQHVQVVRWYIEKNDMSSALDFAQKKLKVFKDQHLWELLELLKKLPSWLFDRLKQLRLLFPFAVEFLSSVLIDMERKKQFARSLAGFLGEDWDSPDDFQLLGSAMLFLLDRIATGKNTPTRKQETLGFATLFAVG